MQGPRIKQAGKCLELLIRSLPTDSFFNIVRFGDFYKPLFPESSPYTSENFSKAIVLAKNIRGNLDGTRMLDPLEFVFKQTVKVGGFREVFVLTDGEDNFDSEEIIGCAGIHSEKNRCFSVGIGDGVDRGIVEGLASASGGVCAFVSDEEDFASKVIPQFEASLRPVIRELQIHVGGVDLVEISPFVGRSITPGVASTVFVRPIREDCWLQVRLDQTKLKFIRDKSVVKIFRIVSCLCLHSKNFKFCSENFMRTRVSTS
jgi:hypothetical protein